MERQMIIDQSCKRTTEQTKTTLSKERMTETETGKKKWRKKKKTIAYSIPLYFFKS